MEEQTQATEKRTLFTEMNIDSEVLRALHDLGFDEPTPIQEQSIPVIKEGKDVFGQAETGSGKTAAFGIPIIEKIVPAGGIQALILAPTRELAEQISQHMISFSKHKRIFVTAVYGGVAINPQVMDLKRADIVVGTPGRMLDHIKNHMLRFPDLKFLVLDEADKMFEMGFYEDVRDIIKECPADRQTLLFSATLSSEVMDVAENHMRNPVSISTGTHVDPTQLKQIYYDVPREKKFSLLVHLLKTINPPLCIVFCNTRHNVDFLGENLPKQGFHALALHGGYTQFQRNDVVEKVRKRETNILIATDVAARGLDITGISHVFNYNIPKTSKEYVHRIGRTARMGSSGLAVNLLDQIDYENFREVLKDFRIQVEQQILPPFPRVFLPSSMNRSRQFNRRDYGHRKLGSRHQRQRW